MNVSVSRDGVELGDWTPEEVRSLYAAGKLLPTDLYWREGMTSWEPLRGYIKPPPPGSAAPVQVAEKKATAKIEVPVAETKKATSRIEVPVDEASTAPPVPPHKEHNGSGAKESDPIVIKADDIIVSAAIQNQYIAALFARPGYDKSKVKRLYKESRLGRPGNRDLCETIVTLNNGNVVRVWFDLSPVALAVKQRGGDPYGATGQMIAEQRAHSFVLTWIIRLTYIPVAILLTICATGSLIIPAMIGVYMVNLVVAGLIALLYKRRAKNPSPLSTTLVFCGTSLAVFFLMLLGKYGH